MSIGHNPKYTFHHPPKRVGFCGSKWFICEWTGQLVKDGWTLQTGPEEYYGIFSDATYLMHAMQVIEQKGGHPVLEKMSPGTETPIRRLHVESVKSSRSAPKRTPVKDHAFIVSTDGAVMAVDYLPKVGGFDDIVRMDSLSGDEFRYKVYAQPDDAKYHVWIRADIPLPDDYASLFLPARCGPHQFIVLTANPEGVPGGQKAIDTEQELKQKRRQTGKRKAPDSCRAEDPETKRQEAAPVEPIAA